MRVFAILDFQIPNILPLLRETQKLAGSHGIELVVPGMPNGPQGIVWDEAVKNEIDRCHAVIGCVDLPNANVGYEIGYAVAQNKFVALTRQCAELPSWLLRSPLKGVMCEQRDTPEQVFGLLQTVKMGRWLRITEIPSPPVAEDNWKAGRFLCPGNVPLEIRQACPTTWESVSAVSVSLEKLSEWVTATPRTIWVIWPHDQGVEARDGAENAALSVVAGFFEGANRQVNTFYHRNSRDVVDLAQSAVSFETASDLVQLIRHLPNAVGNWKDYIREEFLSRWPRVNRDETSLLDESTYHNPFIDSQRLYLLPEKSRAAFKHLHPGSSRAGRDSESEAQLDTGSWEEKERNHLIKKVCETDLATEASIKRLVLTADAGVGKTANVKWFCYEINASTQAAAFMFDAVDFSGVQELDSLQEETATLVSRLAAKLVSAPNNTTVIPSVAREIIRRLRDSGRLTILVDGLDQITSEKPLLILQSLLSDAAWNNCRLIVAGRLHAVNQWREALELAKDEHAWRFVRIGEFTESEQQEDFLGKEKFAALPPDIRTICQVPRVLEFMRLSTVEQIRQLRTVADVVWNAAQALVKQTLSVTATAEDEKTTHNRIGGLLEPGGDRQVQYVHALFAAIAYEMISCKEYLRREDEFHKQGEYIPNFSMVEVDADFCDAIVNRVMPIVRNLRISRTNAEVESDLNRLTSLETVVDNVKAHVFFEQERHHLPDRIEQLENVVWQNRTLQEFYVAYWLSRYATPADSSAFAEWIYYHESITSDWYYFVNQFVAEMPAAAIDDQSWTCTASNWYHPSAVRSTEMLYRSWPTMIKMAGYERIDWHDRGCRAGKHDEWIVKQERVNRYHPPVLNRARDVLQRFWGEFQSIVDDPQHPQQSVATEFIDNQFWSSIPGCEQFEMGLPEELQGTEPKLEAYYRIQVRRVLAGENPIIVAEDCVKPEWSVGRKGLVHRKDDLEWLTPILTQYQLIVLGLTDAAEIEIATQNAVDEMKAGWSVCDETPAEKMVAVETFEIQTVPVIHRWFHLFYPQHSQALRVYLADFDEDKKETVVVPEEDHAASYVSWYDAWAFCQWARWNLKDVNGGTIHYRCRLPHESEWEYAARGNGPRHARYWWGDEFYEQLDSPEVERLSTPKAHADGRRGYTRNPMIDVEANSFGLKDVLGNVWEWTANPYEEVYKLSPGPNQQRPAVNPLRTMRGGLWYVQEHLTKITNRFKLPCDDRDFKMGFRVIRMPRPSLGEG